MGMLTRLKNGAPTLIFSPRIASDRSGKMVPKNTVKAAAIRNRLFSRNMDSRDRRESSSPCARIRSIRQARSEKLPSRTSARKARKKWPIDPWVKAWTEPMMPERVRNVPKMVRLNVRMTRRQVPELQDAPPLLDHHRVEERGRREPRHEGGVLHRVPRPVPAPAEHVVAPPPADQEPEREEVPGHDGPPPRDGDPLLARTAGDEGGQREREGHREAREPQVERDRVRDHPGVFEQGIEPAAVGRHRAEPLEGRGRDGHHEQEEGGDAEHDRQDPGIELGLAAAVPDDDDQRVEAEEPRPQHDRALERAPQRGDPVVERRPPVRVERHVPDREVEGEEGVDEERDRGGEREPHAHGRPLGREEPAGAAARGARGGGRAAPRGQREARHGDGVAQLRDHGFAGGAPLRRVRRSSL